MNIATWNVNSLGVRLPQVLRWLSAAAEKAQPVDILCLQELKLTDDKFPAAALEEAGYSCLYSGQKTYNGVAILWHRAAFAETPTDVIRDIPGFADEQRRIIAATFPGGLRVVCGYFPNGQAPCTDKFAYKLRWLAALQGWLEEELRRHPDLVLLGDFNIAPEDRDVHDPAKWVGQNLVSPEERGALAGLLGLGLHDAFRKFPQADNIFSWWDYRMMGFRRNAGLRIDLILLSAGLLGRCTACVIDKEPRGWEQPTDHAPMTATLDL